MASKIILHLVYKLLVLNVKDEPIRLERSEDAGVELTKKSEEKTLTDFSRIECSRRGKRYSFLSIYNYIIYILYL